MSEALYLIDGTSQLYRAYFALGHLSNAEGLPTNAVFGFTTMLRKLLTDHDPTRAVVAFDPRGAVFRHDEFTDYKANRPPTPEDLKVQVPYAKQIAEALGVHVVCEEGFEADDVIATLARQARAAGFEVVIVASDKDLLQLVGPGTTVYDPAKNRTLDEAGVDEHFGVPPERVLDVLGLMGDSVDNIPGVPGVGNKTALAVVGRYGEVEAVIARAERFAAAWETRDRFLELLDGDTSGEEVLAALDTLLAALASLAELEPDDEGKARLSGVVEVARDVDREAFLRAVADGPRKKAARALSAVKREAKALDRGSQKKIWLSIREHAEQARLSRRLAALSFDVPVEFEPDSYRLDRADPGRANALYRSLGFRTLVDEDAPSSAPAETGATVDARIVESLDGLRALVTAAHEAGRVAVEMLVERAGIAGGRPVGIALATSPTAGFYVPLGHDYLGAPESLPCAEALRTLQPLLEDAEVEKTAPDRKAAWHDARRLGIDLAGGGLDIEVAAFLLQSSRGTYPLERVAEEYGTIHVAPWQEWIGSGASRKRPAELEVGGFGAYMARRAASVLELAGVLRDRLEEAGLARVYDEIDGPLLPVLARMERAGIVVDREFLAEMSAVMERELEQARAKILELAGCDFNPDSPKQLREVLFDRLGLASRRKTAKTGAASTDARALEELAERHPIASAILEYRESAKLKSTYVDALPRLIDEETGRVHTSYHPTGAATGRLSSSDPNLQNIPVRTEAGRRIRKAFVAAPGSLFLTSDYSQIELRVLAHMAEDPGLIEAFRVGDDIHRHTASRVFDVLPELVDDTMRRRAKAINFGLLYGMSQGRLAREQGMTRGEAKKFVDAYFSRFGRVRDYIEATREEARREGAVRTLFGRIRYFPQLHERTNRGITEQALRAAVNTTIQGTAADLMKLAMLAVDRALEESATGARILLQVHDELLLEVPTAEIDEVASRVRTAMENVHRLAVPLVVDQKRGPNWRDAV